MHARVATLGCGRAFAARFVLAEPARLERDDELLGRAAETGDLAGGGAFLFEFS